MNVIKQYATSKLFRRRSPLSTLKLSLSETESARAYTNHCHGVAPLRNLDLVESPAGSAYLTINHDRKRKKAVTFNRPLAHDCWFSADRLFRVKKARPSLPMCFHEANRKSSLHLSVKKALAPTKRLAMLLGTWERKKEDRPLIKHRQKHSSGVIFVYAISLSNFNRILTAL